MRVRFRIAFLIAGCVATLLAAACSTPTAPDETATLSPSTTAPATAMYRVTFQATWSATTHPVDIPSPPHFSRLVGGTHNAATRFWAAGTLASAGIKNMAEEGNVTPLGAFTFTRLSNQSISEGR